jgi:glycosyltransferase involved in cell wall biosynthesis
LLRERTGKADAVVVFGGTHLAAGAVLARDLSAGLVYGHRSNAVREELTLLSEPQQRPFGRLAILTRLAKARHEERRIARLADLVVFQSAYDRDDFRSRVPLPDARTAIIRGDISNPRFEGRYAGINRSTTAARILFIGALSRRKGIDYLIKAIALLRERGHRNLRFEFCGPGDRQNELQKDLSIRGISDIVAIRGRVADPFKVISESDLLVVPSLMDSYPNTVLEALHVGTPVIGSRVGGIPDQLVHDELLFPPMDAAAIADRIERCVREPGFYQLIQELCRSRRAAFCFDWAEAWEKAITSCTQK